MAGAGQVPLSSVTQPPSEIVEPDSEIIDAYQDRLADFRAMYGSAEQFAAR
jgi:hypothetical protein